MASLRDLILGGALSSFNQGMQIGADGAGLRIKNDQENAQRAAKIAEAEALQQKYKGRPINVEGVSIGQNAGLEIKIPQQARLETAALTKTYNDQTKDVKEQQAALEQAKALMKDPSNIDDQQLRRQLAMAVNKGALSDQDVADAIPDDMGYKLRKLYNWAQPALAPLGAKKVPVFSDDTRQNLEKLLTGKSDINQARLKDAEEQVRQMAPYMAPTLSQYNPKGIEELIKGISAPRQAQQGRLAVAPPADPAEARRARIAELRKKLGK